MKSAGIHTFCMTGMFESTTAVRHYVWPPTVRFTVSKLAAG